jgi:hypothetical protein
MESLIGYTTNFQIQFTTNIYNGQAPAAKDQIQKLQGLRQQLKNHWQKANKAYTKVYNKAYQPMIFKRLDLVKLSTKHLNLQAPCRKLAPRFIRPFQVLNTVRAQAYRLSLPSQYDQIYNVFHVSLLEP